MKIANHHPRHSKILTSLMSVVALFIIAAVASGGECNHHNHYYGKRLHDNINTSRIISPSSSLTFINKHKDYKSAYRHQNNKQGTSLSLEDAASTKTDNRSVLFNLRCGGSETAESDETQVVDNDSHEDDVHEEEEGVIINSSDATTTSPSLSVDIVSVVETSTNNDSESLTAEDKLASIAITEQHDDDKDNNRFLDVEETTALSNNDSDDDDDDYDESVVTTENNNNMNGSSKDLESDLSSSEESTSIELMSDNDDNSDTPTTTIQTQDDINDLISKASNKRIQAKTFHDDGNLHDAAVAFHDAASLLDEVITTTPDTDDNNNVDSDAIAVERATCKLHEALCHFKNGKPGECIEACSDVLQDGVTVVVEVQNDGEDEGKKGGTTEEDVQGDDDDDANGEESPVVATVTKVVTTPVTSSSTLSSSSSNNNIIPSLIRARAHHRRAKARLALNDFDGALDDARSAAFMGDRNAVQFYGRLMREGSFGSSGSSEALASSGNMFGSSDNNGSSLLSNNGSLTSTNPFLESMLQGMNSGLSGSTTTTNNNNQHPLMPSGAGSSDFQSSLLSSLLNSNNNKGGSGGDPFGLMSSLLSPPSSADDSNNSKLSKRGRRGKSKKTNGDTSGGGMDNLAKSLLSSLLKRIEDESTQETICNYLQSTNTQQIMTFASMAGMPLKETNANRLCNLAHGVTKEGIRKSITNIKRSISIIKTIRKIFKVVDKYKVVIVASFALYWIRSAIVKPYPVSAKQKKKMELMQKTALSLLIAPSSLSSSSQGGGRLPLGCNFCNGLAQTLTILYLSGNDDTSMSNGVSQTGVEEELERLQNQLSLIEALEVSLLISPLQLISVYLHSSVPSLLLYIFLFISHFVRNEIQHSLIRSLTNKTNGSHSKRMRGFY